jgi:hypothetical protein
MYALCLYGKQQGEHGSQNLQRTALLPATSPGRWSQLTVILATPEFIAHKWVHHRKRYKVTTVFVDHFNGLSFVYLQKSTSAGRKQSRQREHLKVYAKCMGFTIRHYHADNFIENRCEGP